MSDLWFVTKESVVAVGKGGIALLSEDEGQSWEEVEAHASADLACVRFVHGKKGFAAGSIPNGQPDDQFGDGSDEAVGVQRGVFLLTTDGGKTWTDTFSVPGVGFLPDSLRPEWAGGAARRIGAKRGRA